MKSKLKIVLDTNVFLVSLASGYKLHWIFTSLIEGAFDICISNEILTEYQEVISKRYGLEKTASTLDFLLLLPNVKFTDPFFNWNLIEQDKDDNKFVDCAVAASADFIISNDRHFNVLKAVPFPSVSVLTAEAFESLYKEELLSVKH